MPLLICKHMVTVADVQLVQAVKNVVLQFRYEPLTTTISKAFYKCSATYFEGRITFMKPKELE